MKDHVLSRCSLPRLSRFVLLSSVITVAPCVTGIVRADGPALDLAIVNARVWTGAARDSRGAEPFAVGVIGDKIVAVGTDDEIRARVGPRTRVIDADNERVIPGITDSHTHIVGGGFQLSRLQLRDVPGKEEFILAVAAEVKRKHAGEWILGGRWSVESWKHPEAPNKNWLDSATGNHPVFLNRMDGHQALVNSAALKLAGIDASGPADPEGGEIERDPKTKEPTGILKESAMGLVSRLIPSTTEEDRYEALKAAMRHANALGITSVHDMCNWEDLEVFRRADRDGALTLRITAYASVGDWSAYIGMGASTGDAPQKGRYVDAVAAMKEGSAYFRVAGVKGYIDGSMGSRTAYMHEPYSDANPAMLHPRGQLTDMGNPPEAFMDLVTLADAKGLQIAVHAIGDEGNHLLLDAYEAAAQRNGPRDRRHRVEHAQHLLVSDIPRFAKLGVTASMQPYHKADDGRYAEKAIGAERLKGSYAFRQLLDAGAMVVFGSDWPVVTMNPFAGIDSAVHAKTLAGEVWLASHSLTIEEALRAYTVHPPRAIQRDAELGTLEVGRLADLVILDDDPFTDSANRLSNISVVATIVGGRVVHESPKPRHLMGPRR